MSDGQYRVNEGSYRVADLEAVLDSRLEPLGHAVKCLHLELLRQMHASRREEGERAAAFRSAMETMSAEMESLREENARLRKLWRG